MKNLGTIPVGVKLLHCIVQELDAISPLLEKHSIAHKTFKKSLQSVAFFEDIPEWESQHQYIAYVQIMMLAGLSLFGGPSIKPISHFEHDNKTIKITWSTGITEKWTLGQWDASFIQFLNFYNQKVLGKQSQESKTSTQLLKAIETLLTSYKILMSAALSQLNSLIQSPQNFLDTLRQPIQPELLFLIISSLPIDAMNIFLIQIQFHLPEDLRIKTRQGNTVNVSSLFDSKTTDIVFLGEKIMIYLDLYADPKTPIIKEITQAKTPKILESLLKNSAIYSETQKNLIHLKNTQVELRLSIYTLLLTLLNTLNKA